MIRNSDRPAATQFNCETRLLAAQGLDIARRWAEKQFKVPLEKVNFYEVWRGEKPDLIQLKERPDTAPPEILLQAVWSQQRIKRDELRTTTGESIEVLHPGFWNREPGPDFSSAIVRVGSRPPAEGDIEIDIQPSDWKAHGHDRNRDFTNVVLHVVWRSSGKQFTGIPTLELNNVMDAPLNELRAVLAASTPPPLPAAQQGKCSGPLTDLEPDQLDRLLGAAARVRLQQKAAQIHARARQVGWEKTLTERLFRALGYKNNSWPMQRLGELSTRLRELADSRAVLDLQALLLGVGNLLPVDITRRSGVADDYIQRIWNIWWRARDGLADIILPRRTWKLRGLRPANQPQRRLALAAHWICDEHLVEKLESWFSRTDRSNRENTAELTKALQPGRDTFWECHWTLNALVMESPQPLLGPTRTTDLAVNVVLPWFLARAKAGANEHLCHRVQELWSKWPKAEDNVVLRNARARLLGNAGPGVLKTSAHQQGLIQIVRDFCDHSNAICESCQFPKLVQTWSIDPPT